MLDTQAEIDEAISRPIGNDTTDIKELESELEELLIQPIPATPSITVPMPDDRTKEIVMTPKEVLVEPPEQDPFADLELRLQKLGVQECKSILDQKPFLNHLYLEKTTTNNTDMIQSNIY